MAKKEILFRRRFGLPTGLIERSDRRPVPKKSAKSVPEMARSAR
jgi:hypothetical protein